MADFIRAVPVFAPDGTYRGHVEGDLHGAVLRERENHLRRLPRDGGCTRVRRGFYLSSSKFDFPGRNSRVGEDRSWKRRTKKPRGRSLCKRLKRKPQYN
jgi:hypothetical protein